MQEENALTQVAIRMIPERIYLTDQILDTPKKIAQVLSTILKDYDREVVGVVNFQSDLKPINMNIASVGALNVAEMNIREIMKSTILSNAVGIVLFHNHPSGNVSPSELDYRITERMKTVCQIMNIEFYDHVIVGCLGKYYSFKEEKTLEVLNPCQVEELFPPKEQGIKEKLKQNQENKTSRQKRVPEKERKTWISL